MDDLDKIRSAYDTATKNLGKLAGSGPLAARRSAEKKYAAAFTEKLKAEHEAGNPGYMFPRRKFRG